MPSANSRIFTSDAISTISLLNIDNNSSPIMLPAGTPENDAYIRDRELPIRTKLDLPDKNIKIDLTVFLPML